MHRPNVSIVLKYWVLEFEPVVEQDLSPSRLLRVGEDPTLVVLSLNDEHTEPRDENVINLGCAILQPKGDMIHQVIVRRTEVRLHNAGEQRLATILVRGGTVGTVAANGEAHGECNEV
ncbi:MAG: hypothetical protein HCAMLNBO_01654 [Candidatus Brocadia fulgida]|nr:hypothetical protein [Candidatus Brocadia fulgida]